MRKNHQLHSTQTPSPFMSEQNEIEPGTLCQQPGCLQPRVKGYGECSEHLDRDDYYSQINEEESKLMDKNPKVKEPESGIIHISKQDLNSLEEWKTSARLNSEYARAFEQKVLIAKEALEWYAGHQSVEGRIGDNGERAEQALAKMKAL